MPLDLFQIIGVSSMLGICIGMGIGMFISYERDRRIKIGYKKIKRPKSNEVLLFDFGVGIEREEVERFQKELDMAFKEEKKYINIHLDKFKLVRKRIVVKNWRKRIEG